MRPTIAHSLPTLPPNQRANKARSELQLLIDKPFRNGDGRLDLSTVIEQQVADRQACVKLCWEKVRTLEIVIGDIAAQFGGEDPLRPRMRALLVEAKAEVEHVNEVLAVMDAAVELVEPDDDSVADLRELVERAANRT